MMTFSKTRLAAALFALAACLPLGASAGILDDNEARKAILDLRAKVDNLAREVNARIDTKSDKHAALESLNRHEQTLQTIAELRGQIEVLANEVANTQRRQKDLYADLDARIRKIEPRQVTIDGQESSVAPSEQQSYEAAMGLFKTGDYAGAASALSLFVRRYPDSPYAANAQYWSGNAYYAQGDYKNAITAQQALGVAYKDSPQAADAMLNIADSYTQLKDKKNAKKTLQTLVSRYPGTSAAQTAKDRLVTLK
ncbi:tol-pal system protein YbgF [Massilia glaciei]|uniref:Cell division coordinator CpoB n=1 Tax=Massilia glaciei TaxID=1524097 RepID=A0A2U2HKD2_9BURK|nr:tol-pal system protein YbgF [Massilia glaciei]PWF47943.1 tol-pal system protein YbgF [Massilia glaciei]